MPTKKQAGHVKVAGFYLLVHESVSVKIHGIMVLRFIITASPSSRSLLASRPCANRCGDFSGSK
ncbi:hypothetical protein LHK_01722 [Laribacter hongkongensis HLHK9]|uniref:Uncharacterized protein n=1 Tax=Laribacter hongkongensis (strain HLHK9) TaxID=557598 RepID=C1D8B7_LARHH|nr:hypothetical protein LHK_01722 [Laribacter hongkongensis HLHK9]